MTSPTAQQLTSHYWAMATLSLEAQLPQPLLLRCTSSMPLSLATWRQAVRNSFQHSLFLILVHHRFIDCTKQHLQSSRSTYWRHYRRLSECNDEGGQLCVWRCRANHIPNSATGYSWDKQQCDLLLLWRCYPSTIDGCWACWGPLHYAGKHVQPEQIECLWNCKCDHYKCSSMKEEDSQHC